MRSWSFTHPELPKPWYTRARNQEKATQRFEDCWALRIPHGLLEAVDGSFFDGTVALAQDQDDDLCPGDLGGHFWQPDKRPERRENALSNLMAGLSSPGLGIEKLHPAICLMCDALTWRPDIH